MVAMKTNSYLDIQIQLWSNPYFLLYPLIITTFSFKFVTCTEKILRHKNIGDIFEITNIIVKMATYLSNCVFYNVYLNNFSWPTKKTRLDIWYQINLITISSWLGRYKEIILVFFFIYMVAMATINYIFSYIFANIRAIFLKFGMCEEQNDLVSIVFFTYYNVYYCKYFSFVFHFTENGVSQQNCF